MKTASLSQEQIAQLHPGLIGCRMAVAARLMPELAPILRASPVWFDRYDYTVDIKVHMLKRGMYPCIPGHHYDLVPRCPQTGRTLMHSRSQDSRMFLWLSGAPLTMFQNRGDKNYRHEVEACRWTEFNQFDEHEGQAAAEACWRVFIRIAPCSIHPPRLDDQVLRRHSQVYVTDETYQW